MNNEIKLFENKKIFAADRYRSSSYMYNFIQCNKQFKSSDDLYEQFGN